MIPLLAIVQISVAFHVRRVIHGPMRLSLEKLVLICSLTLIACADDGASVQTDGNIDPQKADCHIDPVLHCSGTSTCFEFYSDDAADAVLATCEELNLEIGSGPCSSSHDRCCIAENGSNGYPEGVCLSPSSSDYSASASDCASFAGVHDYCDR